MSVRLLACVALLSACTHHRPLSQARDLDLGRTVTVQTTTGAYSAITIVGPHGVGYASTNGGMIDPSTIVRVTNHSVARGALDGFLIVGGIGFVVGVGRGIADGDDPDCDYTSFCVQRSRGEKAVLGGLIDGALAGVIGLAIGAVVGSDVVYSIDEHMTVTPSGPPGSIAGATLTF
jgi:hypothetical protein